MPGAEQQYRFDAATALNGQPGGRWSGEVHSGWTSIGGQPNGGYLLALALSAAVEAMPGSQPLAATAHYVRPGVTGPADIDVEIVKHGRVKSTVSARLAQGGSDRLRVLATLGCADRVRGLTMFSVQPPDIPGPDDCVVPSPVVAAAADIARRFDYRVPATSRWARGSCGDTSRVDAWIRFADGREPDVASLPLLVDAFPPAIYEKVEAAALVPTLELTVHLRHRPRPGWIQARVQTRALVDGILEEDAELWDSGGRLVAMSRQLALWQPMT